MVWCVYADSIDWLAAKAPWFCAFHAWHVVPDPTLHLLHLHLLHLHLLHLHLLHLQLAATEAGVATRAAASVSWAL